MTTTEAANTERTLLTQISKLNDILAGKVAEIEALREEHINLGDLTSALEDDFRRDFNSKISKIENACSVIDSNVYETTIVEGSIEFFNQRD